MAKSLAYNYFYFQSLLDCKLPKIKNVYTFLNNGYLLCVNINPRQIHPRQIPKEMNSLLMFLGGAEENHRH